MLTDTATITQHERRGLPRLRDRLVNGGILGLARAGRWVEPELLGLRELIRPGDVCLDAGAALGLYTAELSRLVGPTGVVHSVEPLPFAYAAPARLLGLHTRPNVRWHWVALGVRAGAGTMSVPLRAGRLVPGRSFLTAGTRGLGSNAEFDEQAEVAVETETLDRFCARLDLHRVDFLKADVEGAELDLLRGGERVLERFGPTLLLEIEERHLRRFGRTPENIRGWLADRGYAMSIWAGGAWRPAGRVVAGHRNYLFTRGGPAHQAWWASSAKTLRPSREDIHLPTSPARVRTP